MQSTLHASSVDTLHIIRAHLSYISYDLPEVLQGIVNYVESDLTSEEAESGEHAEKKQKCFHDKGYSFRLHRSCTA